MKVNTSKSKNAESFYIKQSYLDANGTVYRWGRDSSGLLPVPRKPKRTEIVKPLEQKVVGDFGCERFIFCSDAGLASESNRLLNHTANRAYIVTQSIKKLSSEYKELAPDRKGFRGLSDHKLVDLDQLTDKDCDQLFYKEEPYSTKKPEQRLLITYSPKYAAYQKEIREKQVERAASMLKSGNHKKTRKNPNDPARFIGKEAITKDGEMADVLYYLDEEKIEQEARYDGLYAVCTDLFDDSPGEILNALQTFEFADVQSQGFIPIYESTKLTDELHRSRGFESDYEFITKRKMREIQKLSKRKQI